MQQQRGPYQEKEFTPDDKRSPGVDSPTVPPEDIKKKLAAKLEEIKAKSAADKAERKAKLEAAAQSPIPKYLPTTSPLSESEEIARINAGLPITPPISPREEAIAWLLAHNLAPLPVAPAFPAEEYATKKGKPKFNGKNPSYIDVEGKPQIVGHRKYQHQLPTAEELQTWFANPLTGLGTLGTDRIQFIDLDRKNYDSQEDIDAAAREIFEKLGGEGLLEQTRSGGWRIAIASNSKGCQIADASGIHRGELLGQGLFAVLAPSAGYISHARTAKIPQVGDLEELNIVPAAGIKGKLTPGRNATLKTPALPKKSTEEPLFRKASSPQQHQRRDGSCCVTQEKAENPTPRRYQKPETGIDPYGRFPADCWQHFGAPLALWLIARHFDPKGQGWAELNMAAIEALTNRKESTIRLWLKKGRDMGLFRFTSTQGTQSIRKAKVKLYYASMARIGALAGLQHIGALCLIDFEKDIKNLRIRATEAIAQDLQKKSRLAAEAEERAIAEEMERKPIKSLPPQEICQPCTNQSSRVLWRSFWAVFVSERFVAYGASQEKISERRSLSERQIRRHLTNSYRSLPSPVRGERGVENLNKAQLHQRLKSSVDPSFPKIFGNEDGKFYLDSEERIWERKCNIYALENQLVNSKPHQTPTGMSDKN